jgi:single-strand DNA-binding protein
MLNKVILIGRSSNKPTVKESQNGTKYCAFSVATNSGYGEKKQTDWHDITAFGKLAELCEQLIDKGTMAYIEGRLQYSTYEKDGQKRKSTKIIADEVTILSPKQSAQQHPEQQPSDEQPNDNPFADAVSEGIPF